MPPALHRPVKGQHRNKSEDTFWHLKHSVYTACSYNDGFSHYTRTKFQIIKVNLCTVQVITVSQNAWAVLKAHSPPPFLAPFDVKGRGYQGTQFWLCPINLLFKMRGEAL